MRGAVVVLGLGACTAAAGPATEDRGRLPTAVVYGAVATAAGAPVAGARVDADVHYPGANCRPGGPGLTGGAPATTDDGGRYRRVVTAPVSAAELCVSVRVTPPAASGLAPVGAAGAAVRVAAGGGAPRDSVRVDVHLP